MRAGEILLDRAGTIRNIAAVKTKITLATLLLSGSLVMLFAAAKVETCEEKFKTCSQSCDGEMQKCKHSGRPDEMCERIQEICVHKCKTDQADCQNKARK